MKNLMIFISPTGSFTNPRPDIANDEGKLIKVQYENSLALGWKKEDLMLVTNFDYQYGDLKAIVFRDVEFFDRKPQASKINAIVKMFEEGMIKSRELYWFHDIDAFQLQPFAKSEVKLGTNEIAVTDYGDSIRWSTGSVFFKKGSLDIFKRIKDVMYKKNINEEMALNILTRDDKTIKKRVKKIDRSYNFTPFRFQSNYKKVIKPLKVVHFHPMMEIKYLGLKKSLDFFTGKNVLHQPLLTQRLVKIFKYHRIT